MEFSFPVIGTIHSCFKEKFGIPRQPGLAPAARGRLKLLPPYDDPAAFDGLETCSHIWLQFVFHANSRSEWKPKVKPPRLGGNKSLGVFATRSPIRPSPIGLSVVRLTGITRTDGKCWLELAGIDLLDGTPVLDIKPYVPYVDCVPEAFNHLAPNAPELISVEIPVAILSFCTEHQRKTGINLAQLIREVLQQDPRPQYQQPEPDRIYGMILLEFNLRWRYSTFDAGYNISVLSLDPSSNTF